MTSDQQWLADRFQQARPQLRSVAYSMLGSHAEAEDAVQESWLRLARVDGDGIDNVAAWLTTVVGRICLDMLRARRTRREDYLGTRLPEPAVATDASDPEQSALAADAIGIAPLVVLETLAPRERLAFVLHDVFGVDYEQIARSSTGRPRPRGNSPAALDAGYVQRRLRIPIWRASVPSRTRSAAATGRDVDALLELLDPEVTFRIDFGPSGPAPPGPAADAARRRTGRRAQRAEQCAALPVRSNARNCQRRAGAGRRRPERPDRSRRAHGRVRSDHEHRRRRRSGEAPTMRRD